MFRAGDTVGGSFDFNENTRKVQTAPDLVASGLTVVSGKIPSSAEGAVILMPGIRTGIDPEVSNTIRIVVEVVGFYNNVLGIEQFLA